MAEIDERLGREVRVYFNDELVGNVKSADLNVEGNTVEINNDSSGDWTEKILARKNWNLSVTTDSDEFAGTASSGSVQRMAREEFFTSTSSGSIRLAPENPQSGDLSLTGGVIVSNYSMSKSTDDIIEESFEFEGNGELVGSVTS